MQKYLCRRFCLGTCLCRNKYSFYILVTLSFQWYLQKKSSGFCKAVFPKVAKTRMMPSVKLPRHCVWGACLCGRLFAQTDHLGLESLVSLGVLGFPSEGTFWSRCVYVLLTPVLAEEGLSRRTELPVGTSRFEADLWRS